MIFYFSGTGNSKWIAYQLSERHRENVVFIPDMLEQDRLKFRLRNDEKIGFVFPVYSWGPPEIVLRFIKLLLLENYRDQYLFFVCSCGDDVGLTQQVFVGALMSKGWKCNAGFSVIMPNNYVLFPGFDVDNSELVHKKLVTAISALDNINNFVDKREFVFSCKEGSFPYIKTRIINPLFTRFQMSPKNFWVKNTCVGCKRCERSCPISNITVQDSKPVWGSNCTSCLACYHVCPQQAVQYGRSTKGKGHYFNPNI